MKTSVVMATYNGEKFLKSQFDSILSQTVLPDEIVVVDDGSCDNTIRIIKEYSKRYRELVEFNVVSRSGNLGYIKNFIDGIRRASNELIFLCDQDDLWSSNKIQEIKEYFEDNSDMIALHSNTDIIDQNDNVIRRNAQEYSSKLKKISLDKYVTKVNYPGMAFAFRKNKILPSLVKILDAVELPTHDWTIGLVACLSNGFYISSNVYTYRRNTGENVALKLEKFTDSTIDSRIEGIKLYNIYYSFLIQCQRIFKETNFTIDPEVYKLNAENRITYLEKRSLYLAIKNIIYLRYYPSIKSYFGDLLLLFKDE